MTPKKMTIGRKELIQTCLERIERKPTEGPRETAREVLDEVWRALDESVIRDLAAQGLGHAVNDYVANRRLLPKPTTEHVARINRATRRMSQTIGIAVYDHASSVLRSIEFYVNGRTVSLFDFTEKDLLAYGNSATSKSKSWADRSRWCATARKTLKVAKVATLGQLPPKLMAKVAGEVESTWTAHAS